MNLEVEGEPIVVPKEFSGGDPRVAFAVKLGKALHKYGTSTHRLETMMNLMLEKIGLRGQFFVTPTGIFASFGLPEEQRTSLIRVESTEVDLEKLALLDELLNRVYDGEVSVSDGARQIDDIVASPPRYGAVLTTMCFAFASGAAARFLGGGLREVLVVTLSGFLLGTLAIVMARSENASRIFEPVGAMIVAATAMLSGQFIQPFSTYIATLAGLIVLVPGLTLTIAIRELTTRNLVSGTARLMGALLLFFQIGFGVALGWQVNRFFDKAPPLVQPAGLPNWTLWLALLVSPLCFAVLFRARPRDFVWIVAICLVSFGGARAGAYLLGPELGVCIGAILVGMSSNLYARGLRSPAAIPMVPGIMLLVPGSIGFGSMAKFIEKDVISAVSTAFSMILVAVALVTGLLIANVLMPPRKVL